MYSIEDAGLPKFDFLGIRNLAILALAVKLVKKVQDKDIDIIKIPLDDKKTFPFIKRRDDRTFPAKRNRYDILEGT